MSPVPPSSTHFQSNAQTCTNKAQTMEIFFQFPLLHGYGARMYPAPRKVFQNREGEDGAPTKHKRLVTISTSNPFPFSSQYATPHTENLTSYIFWFNFFPVSCLGTKVGKLIGEKKCFWGTNGHIEAESASWFCPI